MTAPLRRPLVPEDMRGQPLDTLIRGATVRAIRAARGLAHSEVEGLALQMYPTDRTVQRAATSPATLATSAWAGALGGTAVAALLAGLAPRSAAAKLFEACLRLDLDGVAVVNVPRNAAGTLDPVFVEEGSPAPLKSGTLAVTAIGPPKKMIVLTALTDEVAGLSVPSAETLIRTALLEAAGAALDAAVFSNVAASAARPAGLLNSVAALTATAGGGAAAMLADLKLLATALAGAGGGNNVWLFAALPQAVALQAHVGPAFAMPIIPVRSLAVGTIVAVEIGGVASAYSGIPEIDSSRDATLHFESDTPLPIASGVQGSGVLATPTRSLYQTNTIALRLLLRTAWAVVQPGSVQWISSTTW